MGSGRAMDILVWGGGALCENRPGFGKRAMVLER